MALVQLAGCTVGPSLLIDNPRCPAPCWEGIQPGVTTIEDALSGLQSVKEIVGPVSDPQVAMKRGFESFVFSPAVREGSARVHFAEAVVSAIQFRVRSEFRLGELQDVFGEPQETAALSGRADARWLVVFFLYTDRGVMLRHFEGYWPDSEGPPVVSPDWTVDEITYFDPDQLDRLLEDATIIREDPRSVVAARRPWAGYQEIDYIEVPGG